MVTLHVQAFIENLILAYADELMVHYYYMLVANRVTGPHSHEFVELLKEQSRGDIGYANKLAQRILQLGGEPLRQFSQVADKEGTRPFRMLENTSDILVLIQAVLGLDRSAIGCNTPWWRRCVTTTPSPMS